MQSNKIQKIKPLLNKSEGQAYEELKKTCAEHAVSIDRKVRLADCLPIDNSGISSYLYNYALKSHFDFVIVDDNQGYKPLFAVEYDGYYHSSIKKQQLNDYKKNYLCQLFEFPLLRIESKDLNPKYKSMHLMQYFIEVWFLEKDFKKAQEEGVIPFEEGFHPFFLHHDAKGYSCLDPASKTEEEIEKFYKRKLICDSRVSYYAGYDKINSKCTAIAYLRIDNQRGLHCQLSTSNMLFLDALEVMCDYLAHIAICELYEKLILILNNKLMPMPLIMIKDNINRVKNNCHISSSCIVGGEL